MPWVSKAREKAARAALIRLRKHQSDFKIVNTLRFCFAILVEGESYGSISRVFRWNNIEPPPPSTFYEKQKIIIDLMEKYVKESINFWRSQMAPNTIIAIDGSWSHRRNAPKCLVDFIDTNNKKVVWYEILEKGTGKSKGNFEGASNMMEVAGVERFIDEFKGTPEIVGYVHDNDAKTSAAFREKDWNIEELLDRNHLKKAFHRKLSKTGKLLRGLHERLEKWFNYCLQVDATHEERIDLWLNAYYHYIGDHSCCNHADHESYDWPQKSNEESRKALYSFLLKSAKLLNSRPDRISTQMCESLHAIKAKMASKRISWKISWKARVYAAILDVNLPFWRFRLYRELFGESLSAENYLQLYQEEIHRVEWNTFRRSEEFRIIARQKRAEQRAKNKVKGPSGYKGIKGYNAPKKETKMLLHEPGEVKLEWDDPFWDDDSTDSSYRPGRYPNEESDSWIDENIEDSQLEPYEVPDSPRRQSLSQIFQNVQESQQYLSQTPIEQLLDTLTSPSFLNSLPNTQSQQPNQILFDSNL